MLDSASKNRIPKFMFAIACGIGIGVHIIRARRRARVGDKMKSIGDACVGRMGSLINNLMPSATGCKIPSGPTILGPFRSCI